MTLSASLEKPNTCHKLLGLFLVWVGFLLLVGWGFLFWFVLLCFFNLKKEKKKKKSFSQVIANSLKELMKLCLIKDYKTMLSSELMQHARSYFVILRTMPTGVQVPLSTASHET